ncbi:MAG: putative N-acetylmannosamine-6-phosphate 2-epimerase [Bacteroidetes bacterium]|nr:putative N-acetylmannosamine-6-phosphate 2-epimerase [Bacteroidota bacterium]
MSAKPFLPRGLVVSCQAEEGSPFHAPAFVVAFARAAELGGAVAVRLRDVVNVTAVRAATTLPIIALTKGSYADGRVLITPDRRDVEQLFASGADMVAVDVTDRVGPDGVHRLEWFRRVRNEHRLPLMADVATYEEGLKAAEAGADLVGTTLSGYTDSTSKVRLDVPDFELIERLAKELPGKVVAEGRIWTPEQAALALRLGAAAVVVGTAITRPVDIVKRFASTLNR